MRKKLMAGPYLLWMLVFTIVPLLFVFYYGFTSSDGTFTFSNITAIFEKIHIQALGLSLLLAVITTAVCLLFAYPLALILSKSAAKNRSFVIFIFILPMWINFVLRTAAMKELLFKIGMYRSSKLSMVNTVIGMVYDYLPFTILPLYTVLIKLDKSILEASADLGATSAQTFFKVVIPLSAPGIVSAITMVLLPTTTSYVVSDTLGNGNVTIIGKLIEDQFSSMFDWHAGSAIAMILLILIFITMFVTRKFSDEQVNTRGGGLW